MFTASAKPAQGDLDIALCIGRRVELDIVRIVSDELFTDLAGCIVPGWQ